MGFNVERYRLNYIIEMLDGLDNFDEAMILRSQAQELLKELKGAWKLPKAEQEKLRKELEEKIGVMYRDFEAIYETLPESELY